MACLDVQALVANGAEVTSNLGIAGGNITMAIWVNFDTAPTTDLEVSIMSQSNSVESVQYNIGYRNTAGVLKLIMTRDRNNIASSTITFDTTLTIGQWFHIAGSYDGTNLFLYINGDFKTSGSGGTGAGAPGAQEAFSVGYVAHASGDIQPIDGKIAHAVCYNEALSAVNIKRISQSRPPNNDTNLVLYWPLNEGSGTTTNDHADRIGSNNGSITTAIWSTLHPQTTYK